MIQVILASSSPRRSEILNNLNIPFKQIISEVDEDSFKSNAPINLVTQLSYEKANSVVNKSPDDAIIIGADTVVCYDERILFKPSDEEEAFDYLSMLAGECHYVYTGITLINKNNNKTFTDYCMTKVYMRSLKDEEIKAYIGTNEPFDKAGAYGIQGFGAALVSKIDGDYQNVVGLPVSKLIEGFNTVGIDYFNSFHK